MKRIFIALKVEPTDKLLSIISILKQGLCNDSIKWTNPDNIHITLAFLGDTEENMIKDIKLMLKEKCDGTGKFELVLKGAGLFRNLADPRIIWTGLVASEKLLQLNEVVMSGLKELNIKMEERTYNPHLTIGRIKHVNDKEKLKLLIEQLQNSEIQIVPVDEIVLYESILLQTGPVYKPIGAYSL